MITVQNWRQLAAVQIGSLICLPMLLVGYELARLDGGGLAMSSIAIGNGILTLIALVVASMSFHYKATTAELGFTFFGEKGRRLFTLILVGTMTSWFAVQTQVMSADVSQTLNIGVVGGWEERGIRLLLAGMIIVIGLSGLKGITLIADCCVPLMVATIGCALYYALGEGTFSIPLEFGFSSRGVSLILAASIAAVVDLSTFFRHAATRRDGVIASLLIFSVATPLVELAGVCLYRFTEAPQLTDALRSVPHLLWDGWILFFLLLAGWTVNNANLYSAGMNFASLKPSITGRMGLLAAGSLAILLSCCDLLAHFAVVLDIMGIAMAAMGAALLTSYLFRPSPLQQSLIGWCCGVAGGITVMFTHGGISGSPTLDAFIIATVVTAVLCAVSYLQLLTIRLKKVAL